MLQKSRGGFLKKNIAERDEGGKTQGEPRRAAGRARGQRASQVSFGFSAGGRKLVRERTYSKKPRNETA